MKFLQTKSNLTAAIGGSLAAFGLPILYTGLTVYASLFQNMPSEDCAGLMKLILLMCVFSTFFAILFWDVLLPRIQVSKEGVVCKTILFKKIVYTWDEVVSIGIDCYLHQSINHKLLLSQSVYISKKEVPEFLPQTNVRRHPIWKQFYSEHKLHWSLKKERNTVLIFELDEKQLAQFKAFLPKELLERLEASEKRFIEAYPNFKK